MDNDKLVSVLRIKTKLFNYINYWGYLYIDVSVVYIRSEAFDELVEIIGR